MAATGSATEATGDTEDTAGTDGTDGTDGTTTDDLPIECGNGVVQVGEECDDGNQIPDDECSVLCTLPVCGDGVTQMGEGCDAGVDNGPGKACLADCKVNVCGDGDQGPGEGCDDGNQVDDDACANDCSLTSCGDGKLNEGEACDDGNDDNTDACTDKCTEATCGDSHVQPPEACDDGAQNSDNAKCTSMCALNKCGDGLLLAGSEQCDDGPQNGPNQTCLAGCIKNVCGDGDKGPGEECDLGAKNGSSMCHANCKLNVCGDGKVGPGELCDDGNKLAGDGCSAFCVPEVKCGNKIYQCGNGIDDDGDGKIDLADPECTSPCDDSEKSFQTNLPGQNLDCKSDCYWDANSGAGDDKCEWNLKCDPKNPGATVGCAYDPNYKMCSLMMPPACLNFCVPLVPNGCDCFGCCQIGAKFYYLNSGPNCSLDNLAACNQCTFFDNCANKCEPAQCELCFGQDIEDLPPECNDTPTCQNGVSCADISDCQVGEFCQTGCCTPIQPL